MGLWGGPQSLDLKPNLPTKFKVHIFAKKRKKEKKTNFVIGTIELEFTTIFKKQNLYVRLPI